MDYNALAPKAVVEKTLSALKKRNIEVFVVANRTEALAKIKELIPAGASVMNGSSTTLEQIGYEEYLKSGKHGWNDLHANVTAEDDKEKRAALRKQAVLSDYYLGSVHALLETGEFIIASQSGSQLPHIVYTSPNLIFVVSTKKIVADFEAAMKRLKEHTIPLEDKNMQEKYGTGTALNKLVTFYNESLTSGRKVRMILVEENLGF